MTRGNFQIFAQIIDYIIKYFKWVVFFAALLIAASGIYRVQSYETAIVLRFGRLRGNTPAEQLKNPGLHFALPFFIDEVIKVPVQTMQERDIMTHYMVWGNRILADVDRNGYLLSGDNNVVLIRASVLYQIENPVEYAIYQREPGLLIDGIVSGELTRQVSQMDIDSVLTRGRAELSSVVLINSQGLLDALNTGIRIAAVELIGIVPPMETAQYFDDVRSAAVYKETLIREAQESASSLLINAQGEARAHSQAAISDQHTRLAEVYDNMTEFTGLLDLYAINPNLIMEGIFRERLGAIIAQSGGSVILPEGSQPPFILLP